MRPIDDTDQPKYESINISNIQNDSSKMNTNKRLYIYRLFT